MRTGYQLETVRQGREVLAALGGRYRTARGGVELSGRSFFDTFDWRLWQAGIALSGNREAGGSWSLYWQQAAEETEQRGSSPAGPGFVWDLPEGPLRRELEPVVEMRRLLPLVQLEQRSEEVCLLDRRRKTVARLRLESWQARATGAKSAKRLPPRLLALPVRGYDRDFARLVGFLDRRGLARATGPVLEQAYAACQLQPGDYQAKIQVSLSAELPAHLALRRIHLQLLDTIRRNEDGLRQDLDSEFLHDFRVAVRRTRAALTQVKGVLPAERVAWFRGEFKWLGGQTGTLRDRDVYLLKLDDYRSGLPVGVAADLGPLEGLLRREQKSEHRRVVRALRSKRYRRLLSDWQSFLGEEESPDTPPDGLSPIAEVARDRILGAHARVIKKGRVIGPETRDEKLHRLRIDCKKLRYLLEFFRDLYGPKEIGKVIKSLKGLQDNLGDFNDLSVQQGAMIHFAEELTAERAPAAALLALGQLIANLARRHDVERRRFHDQFERFDRRKVRRRLRDLVEGAVR